jgi:hypothetical protein
MEHAIIGPCQDHLGPILVGIVEAAGSDVAVVDVRNGRGTDDDRLRMKEISEFGFPRFGRICILIDVPGIIPTDMLNQMIAFRIGGNPQLRVRQVRV